MSKHTPTPWHVRAIMESRDIVSETGVLIAEVSNEENGREANARHIVHCVNSHDDLVEALKFVLTAFNEFEDILDCSEVIAGISSPAKLAYVDPIRNTLEQAIAKAEED